MMKLHQSLDDDILTRELPSSCTCVLGQIDKSGRRVANPKCYSLTVTFRCVILCFIPMTFALGMIMLISKGLNTGKRQT